MGVLTDVIAVFTEITTWFISAISSVIPIFYSEGLTFIGVLAVASLGIAITLLIVRWVREFLSFRN